MHMTNFGPPYPKLLQHRLGIQKCTAQHTSCRGSRVSSISLGKDYSRHRLAIQKCTAQHTSCRGCRVSSTRLRSTWSDASSQLSLLMLLAASASGIEPKFASCVVSWLGSSKVLRCRGCSGQTAKMHFLLRLPLIVIGGGGSRPARTGMFHTSS